MDHNKGQTAIIKMWRKQGSYDIFEIPYTQGISVLWALKYIYENLDSSIAYPLCLCRIGKCGNCAVRLNGKGVLACSTMINPDEEYILEPIDCKKVIKDLVVRRG